MFKKVDWLQDYAVSLFWEIVRAPFWVGWVVNLAHITGRNGKFKNTMQFVFFKFYTHASLQNCCSIKNKPDLGLTRSSSWLCYLLAVWPWLDYLMCLSVQFPSPALFTLWGLWGFSQLLYTRNSGIRRIYKEFCVSLPFQMRFLPALLILDRWTFIRKHCRNVGPEWIWASNSFWARQTWASHTHTA